MRRGNDRFLSRLAAADSILLPTIVLGELEAGFEMGRRAAENRVALAEFLDESFVVVLPVSASVARRYGRVFSELRRQGTPIPVNEIWIAACTIDSGAHLLTFDRHFESVPGLDASILAV